MHKVLHPQLDQVKFVICMVGLLREYIDCGPGNAANLCASG